MEFPPPTAGAPLGAPVGSSVPCGRARSRRRLPPTPQATLCLVLKVGRSPTRGVVLATRGPESRCALTYHVAGGGSEVD